VGVTGHGRGWSSPLCGMLKLYAVRTPVGAGNIVLCVGDRVTAAANQHRSVPRRNRTSRPRPLVGRASPRHRSPVRAG